jgi:hypothetical protein
MSRDKYSQIYSLKRVLQFELISFVGITCAAMMGRGKVTGMRG